MKKKQDPVRALAKKAYARAAANENICIEAIDELLDIVESANIDDALALFVKWCQMSTQYNLVTFKELATHFNKKDLARHRIFLDGRHAVIDGTAICAGPAILNVAGNAHIYAFEDSHVNTDDACFVWAHDNASVHAKGGLVYAFHYARVKIRRGLVYAFDDSIVDPCSRSMVSRSMVKSRQR